MFSLNTRLHSFQEELFEAFMPEFLDHIPSVTWDDSVNKEECKWVANGSGPVSDFPPLQGWVTALAGMTVPASVGPGINVGSFFIPFKRESSVKRGD
jgi:hypothetical protein